MLHITNGDCAVPVIRGAGVPGDILPWRDVLHEGPVDGRLPLEDLSRRRAAFIADAGWGPRQEVDRQFAERDARLRACGADEEVVLWLEHDLYDQLQLIQLLDWFAAHPHPRLTLVCEEEYLGHMASSRAATLFASRKRVGDDMLEKAGRAWRAFGSDDPSTIPLHGDAGLRFLAPALKRVLEEYPWTTDGLSRMERAVIGALQARPLAFEDLFARVTEEPMYLGDATLAWHLERMAGEGLLEKRGGAWALRSARRPRRLPRWIGGVLLDERSPWRWDPGQQRITRNR